MLSAPILKLGSRAGRVVPGPRTFRTILITLLTALAAASCDAGSESTSVPSAKPASFRMDQATVRMDEGATARLRVLVTESDGTTHELSGSGVTWTVRDPDVASVVAGLVTARRPGATQVIATAGGTKTATAELVVLAVPGSVEILTGDRQVGTVGKSLLAPIRLQVLGRDGRPLRNVGMRITPLGPGGSVSPADLTTDANGMIEATWTLGTRAGAQAADVTIADRQGVVGVVSAMAVPGSVAKIEVTPSDALVTPGGHIRYAAVAVDQYGNPVPDAVLRWGVQDSLVATITQDGVVLARTEGETGVEARYIAPTLATLSGQGPPDTRGWGRFKSKNNADVPEQVSDLYSPSQATSSVTLAFTQVGDGTGAPADYEVRYLPSPIGSNFEGATVARTGSCKSPITGTAIGARLTCSVDGLEAGQTYDFQVVSFRGTMGAGEVRGPVSNVVTAKTSGAVPAAIEIAGGNNQTGNVGSELPNLVVVRVKSTTGAAMPGVPVTWTVVSGGGSVQLAQTNTNALGLAENRWRMGTSAGPAALKASVGALSTTFSANAVAPTSGPASITLTPNQKTIQKGQTYQLSAEARDAQGNVVPNAVLNWTSSDATRATVSSSGMVYGIDAGTAVIRASAGSAAGTADIAVQPVSGSGYPADVTTLKLVSTTSHSATIRFTEVDDGTGKPADYSVRYHQSPIGWNWALATRVTEGTCAAVKGSAIGNERTCVIEGLSAATAYDVQMVAHRTDADGSLVLSERLSNVATGTTLAATDGTLTISPAGFSVSVGATRQLSATARAADGSTIYNPGVTWASANSNIASIDSNGMLTARGVGVVAITAAAACCAPDTITVTVEKSSTTSGASISVNPLQLSVGVGKTAQASATVKDASGNVIPNASITWETFDSNVATVDANGVVTGRKAGLVSIAARSGSLAASLPVTVDGGSSTPSISVSPLSLSLGSGESKKVTATVRDGTGQVIQNATVTWQSYNTGVATVASDGMVAGKSSGQTSVVASYNGVSAALPVSVSGTTQTGTSITVSPATMAVEVGKTAKATATVRDASGNVVNAAVTWDSFDSSIASVAADGTVTGQKSGVVSIVARSGTLAAALPVTVAGAGSGSISVDPQAMNLQPGLSRKISATLRDGYGNVVSGASFTWESGNTSVATVASDGTVTGRGSGSTSVIVRSGSIAASVSVAVQESDPTPTTGPGWPNEPAGWTVMVDESFRNRQLDSQPGGRWEYGNGFQSSSQINVTSGNGPQSGPDAMRWTYPAGYGGGDSPGRAVITDTSMQFRSIYLGVWIRWSLPWSAHSSGANKILYWGSMEARLASGWGPSQFYLNRRDNYIDITLQYAQTNGQSNIPSNLGGRLATTNVDDGRWHRIEMIMDGNAAGQSNCRVRVWVDGILNFDVGNMVCSKGEALFYGINLDPIWGGVGGNKPQTDWLEFDHVRMTGRR